MNLRNILEQRHNAISLIEPANNIRGHPPERGEEALANIKTAFPLGSESGGRKRLRARLLEHETVEGGFLANASRKPLEGWETQWMIWPSGTT